MSQHSDSNNPNQKTSPEVSIYQSIGGAPTIRLIVERFYDNVAKDALLAPLFPEDFTETKEKQYLFLTQFLGGPPLYNRAHGHPMLRARHMPFPITSDHAEAWLACMEETLVEVGRELKLNPDVLQNMFIRLHYTAHHMVNTEMKSH